MSPPKVRGPKQERRHGGRRPVKNHISREHAATDSVYWMESSKRRQALAWLARDDLTPGERNALERFVSDYRTGSELTPSTRRSLLAAFDRIARRLRGAAPE